jgi:hypothetical protein
VIDSNHRPAARIAACASVVAAACAWARSASASARAVDDSPRVEAEGALAIATRHYFRGIEQSRGPTLEAAAAFRDEAIEASIGAAWLLTERDARHRLVALAPALGGVFESPRVSVSLGAEALVDASHPATTTTFEAVLAARLSLLEPRASSELWLRTSHALDVDQKPGAYFGSVGLAFEREWRRLRVELALDVAFVDEAWAAGALGVVAAGLARLDGEGAVGWRVDPSAALVVRAVGGPWLAPSLARRVGQPITGALTLGVELAL